MTGDRVLIVGDGPTGLSAALLLAKTGFDVQVVGADKSPVHKAMLHNFLGLDVEGPMFLEQARAQAERFGARVAKAQVERIERADARFRVQTDAGAFEAETLVLATGFDASVTEPLGLAKSDSGAIRVDHDGRTSVERVYAGGAVTRGMKSQVATSVGDGAAIAVDILSRARGKPSHDYDVLKAAPPKRETTP